MKKHECTEWGSVEFPLGFGWYIQPGWTCDDCGRFRFEWRGIERHLLWWKNRHYRKWWLSQPEGADTSRARWRRETGKE